MTSPTNIIQYVGKCRNGIWEKWFIITVQSFQKKPNPWVHHSVGNEAWASGWDFLSSLNTNDGFYLSHIPVPARRKDKKRTVARRPHAVPWRHCSVKNDVTMSDLSVFRIFGSLFRGSFCNIKCNNKFWARKRIHYLCEDVIEKSLPPYANLWSSGQIFLSHPHTHDGF